MSSKDTPCCAKSLEVKRQSILKSSRLNRDSLACQEALLIGLLSKYATITIRKPSKVSKVTKQFISIDSISFNGVNDKIIISDFIKQRCDDLLNEDLKNNIPMKTAKRRYQNNKKLELLTLMQDILTEEGYLFITKINSYKSTSKKLERICYIYKDGNYMNIDVQKTSLLIHDTIENSFSIDSQEYYINNTSFSFF